MKLILAQGNPGTEYRDTRHNVGFRLLDAFAARHDAEFSEKSKFHTYLAEYTVAGEKILLAKPVTFYNDTGLAARSLVDFYKLNPATDVVVVHDDMALPLGTVRTREKGSDAGNNGIKSLNSHLGAQYKRIRVGIWSEPARQMDTVAFVLGKFTSDEQKTLDTVRPVVLDILDRFTTGTFEATSHS